MIGLDTNVLVRFFAQDDPLQSPRADEIMSSLTTESPGWVGLTTVLELVWVLGNKGRFDRKAITRILDQLLSREEIEIEQDSIVQNAVQLFRRGNADFADCLIASSARAAGCSRTFTFDRIAAQDAGMHLIE
ncbi:MAG TPA: type II toxin-antitoxin system VapC family toxin [Terracidiphilus sp.]